MSDIATMTKDSASSPPLHPSQFRTIDRAPLRRNGRIVNAMSVDVEDYFQVQAFAGVVDRSNWDGFQHRVETNTDRVLQIFADNDVKATFFCLGWVTERYPGLIKRIVAAGHEIGSHGWAHYLVTDQSPEVFREDVRRARKLLQDVSGQEVPGYRASTFSIGRNNLWALDILAEEGHRYSSSIFPVNHDLYGMPEAPRRAFRPRPDQAFDEYPMTTIDFAGRILPCSGGGYFRLLPYPAFRWAIERFHAHEQHPCIFYFHPWEIDPAQPRIRGISAKSRFRHYLNLGRMETRLRRLTRHFQWDRMDRVFGLSPNT